MSNKINQNQLTDFINEPRTVKAFDLLFKDTYENVEKTNSLNFSVSELLETVDNLKTRLDVTMFDLATLTTAHNQLRTDFDDYVATHP